MPYQIPESKQSIDQDVFSYGPTTGEEYQVKKAKYISTDRLERVTAGSMRAILDVFGQRGTPEGDFIRSLDVDQLNGLLAAWFKDSGISMGESLPS